MTAPTTASAATGRNIAALLTRLWRVQVTGAHHVPLDGPVILVANHTGVLDGPVLLGASPRPVHVMAKSALYVPPLDRVLRATGQIELEYETPDRSALLTSLAVLRAGGVIGVFPEAHRGAGDVRHVRHGAAYLTCHSGALVVPVAVLGTRPPGAGKDSLPRLRSRVDVVFGEPVDVRVAGDPHRRAVVARSGERLRQALADHVQVACDRTGQPLPGPLPVSTPDHRSTA